MIYYTEIQNQEIRSHNTVNYSDSTSQKQNTSISGKRSETAPKKREITEEELCDVIMIIKKHIEGRSLQKGIEMLYEYVVKKKNPQKVFCDYVPPLSHIPEAPKNYNYIPRDRSQIIRIYDKNDILQVQFSSKNEQIRYKQKRACAKMFVANGYDLQNAQQQLLKLNIPIKMNQETYKIVMNSVASSTFRQIQTFLIKDCQIKILPLDKQQLKNTLSLLLGQKLQNYGSIFKIFLRLKFGLSNVKIVETDTVYFYLQLMKLLHKKKMTVQGIEQMYRQKTNSQNQSQSWNHSQPSTTNKAHQMSNDSDQKQKNFLEVLDKNIVQKYKQQKSTPFTFYKIRKQMNIQQSLIKQRFRMLVKKALQKVQNQSNNKRLQQTSLPKLIELNDQQIQLLSDLPDFQDLKLNLFDYQSQTNANPDDLYFLIVMINESKDLLSKQNEKTIKVNQNQSLNISFAIHENK